MLLKIITKPYIIIFNTKSNMSQASYGYAMLGQHLMQSLPHTLPAHKCYVKTSAILSFTMFPGDKDLHLAAVIILK